MKKWNKSLAIAKHERHNAFYFSFFFFRLKNIHECDENKLECKIHKEKSDQTMKRNDRWGNMKTSNDFVRVFANKEFRKNCSVQIWKRRFRKCILTVKLTWNLIISDQSSMINLHKVCEWIMNFFGAISIDYYIISNRNSLIIDSLVLK